MTMTADVDAIWDADAEAPTRVAGGVLAQVRRDHVAVVEFDRPPTNFFDRGLLAGLVRACHDVAEAGARAIVLCSTGRIFCAGADFGATSGGQLDPAALYAEAVRLFRQPLPIVAAVQGAAIGGGTGLALAADLRVAAPEARFAVNFAQIGIHPGFGLSVTLPRVVGEQAALELFYTGRRIAGEEASRLGLVDRLASVGQVRRAALELAVEIAGSAPLAVAAIRRTMRSRLADEVEAIMAREAAEQLALFTTEDFTEGVAAVSDRRPGRFAGR